jgi:hypothetical protein
MEHAAQNDAMELAKVLADTNDIEELANDFCYIIVSLLSALPHKHEIVKRLMDNAVSTEFRDMFDTEGGF